MSYNREMKKRYTPTIKAKIVTELLKEEKTLAQLSSEFGVSTKQLTRWKNHALAELPRLFETKSDQNQEKYETKINELYAEIGRLTTQVNWLKKKSGLNLEPDWTAGAGRARRWWTNIEAASRVVECQPVKFVLSTAAALRRRNRYQTSAGWVVHPISLLRLPKNDGFIEIQMEYQP